MVRRFACLVVLVVVGTLAPLVLLGCQSEVAPPLVDVAELAPREIEVGDRLEVRGAGFPQGRAARVSFRGKLHRPGDAETSGAVIEAEGIVASSERIEIVVSEGLEERFCGRGDRVVHTTFEGDVEVAFASSAPGAPPLASMLRGITLDVRPASVPAAAAEARSAEGARLLAYLGVTPGPATPRGLPVERLQPGAALETVGVQPGDLLTSLDGVRVAQVADLVPSSSRIARLGVLHAGATAEEVHEISLAGFAPGRVPRELVPALVIVASSLAVLLLLVMPGPARLTVTELRLAARLRRGSWAASARALFGAGHELWAALVISLVLGLLPLGPRLLGADVDGVVLFVAAVALLVGSRVVTARTALEMLRVGVEVGACVAVLAVVVVAAVAFEGALSLSELVHAQGGAPWAFSAARHPAAALLAFVYTAALVAVLRIRAPRAALSAHPTAPATPPRTRWLTPTGEQLERLGLIVASAVAVVLFLGGWQLPGAGEARAPGLQGLAAVLFVAKAWAFAALARGVASVLAPWQADDARAFVWRRLLPVLAGAIGVALLCRRLAPGPAFESAWGTTVVAVAVLVLARSALRVREALARPEPQASPFL